MEVYISLIPLLILLWALYYEEKQKKMITMRRIAARKGRNGQMLEFAKNFVGKECVIYTISSQLDGVVKEVSDSGMLVEKDGACEVVNLGYVIRIREYPRKKNGKKKSVVLD